VSSDFGPLDPELAAALQSVDETARSHHVPDGLDQEARPGKIYVDGREVWATFNAADGIWVAGLPGEMPGSPYGDPYGTARVGDVLADHQEQPDTRFGKFTDVLFERVEDISDELDHLGTEVAKLVERGPLPTHSSTGQDHLPAYSSDVPDHGIDGGHVLNSVLVLAALAVKLRQVTHREGSEHHARH
jgi:hypothetical protein